jgi:diguanylate cyclase (GGDEF)-like protein/PAS domain S-box-containing protein
MYAPALLSELAPEAPLLTVSHDAVVTEVAALLVARRAGALLVVDERGPAGVLSALAVVRALLEDPDGAVGTFAEGPPGVLVGHPTVDDARAAAASAGSPWAYWQRDDQAGALYLVADLPRALTEQRRAEREAMMFRQAVEQSPVSIVITGIDGVIEYVNPRFTEITGFAPDEALGKNPRIVQSGNTPHAVYEQMWATIVAGGEWSGAIQNRRKNGELYWEQVRIAPVRGEHGAIDNFVAVKEDVTRQRELEARTRMLASVFENARDGLLVASAEGHVAEVNDGFAELTGRPRADHLGRHVSTVGDAGSAEDAASFEAALELAGSWKGDRSFTRPSGEIVTAQVSIDAVRDPAGITTHFIGVCTDVTPLKNQQRRLAAQARTDALTGLLNRAGLLEGLERALVRRRLGGTLVAVGLLDLDGFKSVNDRFGHDAGDALLCEAARRLRGHLRANDIVARLGGDEFVVVLEGLRAATDLEDSAARLVRSLSRPFEIGNQSSAVSGSLGVAFAPTHGDEPGGLLAAADRAMYMAKALGGCCWCAAQPAA